MNSRLLKNLSKVTTMPTSSSLEEPECATPNWLELPVEVTAMILAKLGVLEILQVAQRVCMTWHRVCKDPSMWRSLVMLSVCSLSNYKYEMMWGHTVDRSCGQLKDINIGLPISHGLLCYILDRAPKLSSLRIGCPRILEGLDEIGIRLPQLEELHISSDRVPKEVLESFGRCCPELKSLTYNYDSTFFSDVQNSEDDEEGDEEDDEALIIAQTMPGLHHLSLCGNQMTNHGLQTILDRCPHLESLDLRDCLNVDLQSNLGRSCVQRIKNLKLPNEYLSSDDSYYSDYDYYDNYDSYTNDLYLDYE